MVKLPIVGHVISLVKNSGGGKGSRGSLTREERLRLGFEQAPVGIAFASSDGHWLQVNDRFRELIGYTREELARISFHSITHPEDAKKEAAMTKKLVAGDMTSFRIDKRIMEKRGKYRALDVLTSIVRTPDGAPDFFIYLIDEPTGAAATKRADTPREADRLLSAVVDELNDIAVIRTDDRGIVTGWNAGAQRIFGYRREEIVGKNRRVLYRDPDSWEGKSTSVLKQVADAGRLELEDWRVTKDGRHMWVKTSLTPFRPDGATVRGYLEIVSGVGDEKATIDTSRAGDQAAEQLRAAERTIESLRAELTKSRGMEESLREALEQLRVMGEETMDELRIMTVALRNEMDRRKAVEEELRAANERLAAPAPVRATEPLDVEEELDIALDEEIVQPELPPRKRWKQLGATTPAELLIARAEEQGSGTLVIASGEREKEIFFDRGRIVSVASNDPTKFLTQRLIEAGAITEEQRRKALEIKRETQLAIGRILVILEAISEEQLIEAMRAKMEDEIADVFDWKEARWVFVEGEVPTLQLVPLRLEVTPMIVRRLARPAAPMLVASSAPKSKKKYHRAECTVASRIAENVRRAFASEEEAKGGGYEACRLCFRT